MHDQEQDPSYRYAIHQSEFALPEQFRGEFLKAYDKFSQHDPHDLDGFEKALDEDKEHLATWVAAAMRHVESLSSSAFTPEEIQDQEDRVQRIWEKRKWTAQDLIDTTMKRGPKVLPRWACILLLASYPLEKETISEEQKRELTAFAFESMNSISATAAVGAELAKTVRGDEYQPPEVERQKKTQTFPAGLVEQQFSPVGVQTKYTITDREFSYDSINVWRLLSRRGLTQWKEFLSPEDKKRTREEIDRTLRVAITNELTRGKNSGNPELSHAHWAPSEGLSEDTRGQLQQAFSSDKFKLQEDVAVTPDRKMISVRFQPKFGKATEENKNLEPGNSLLQFGWYDMPDGDLRLSFEIPKNLPAEQQVSDTLDKPIKAIVDAFMDGVPISCKITMSDFGGSGNKRLMIYADYSTARDLLGRLRNLGYETKGKPGIVERDGKDFLFPFGGPRVHVRGSGEAEFSKAVVRRQLELLQTERKGAATNV